MQLLKHLANAMQRAEGFVLERALVIAWYTGKFNRAGSDLDVGLRLLLLFLVPSYVLLEIFNILSIRHVQSEMTNVRV